VSRELRVAVVGLALLAVALGIGRFLLTPLLPLMQADAGLSLIGGGWLAAVNNVGYLAGALLCMLLKLRPAPALRSALLVVAASTLGMGLTQDIAWLLFWRLLAGIAAALLVVQGTAWSLVRLRGDDHRMHEALVFSGTSIGIVVTGVLVAAMAPWRVTSAQFWLAFGLLGLLASAALWRALAMPGAAATPTLAQRQGAALVPAWALIAAYGLFGLGYVIPATFLPLIAEEQLHLPQLREWFWPLYGAASVLLTLLLPRVLRVLGNRHALAVAFGVMFAGTLIVLTAPGIAGFAIASILLGGPLMASVMLVMREARRLAPRDPTRLIAILTSAFGIGQIIGPLIAAHLAAHDHGFARPLQLAALAFLAAALLVLLPPDAAMRRSRSEPFV